MNRFFRGAAFAGAMIFFASIALAGPMYLSADSPSGQDVNAVDQPTLGSEESGGVKPNISVQESSANPVPEPATLLLFGVGLVGLAGWRRVRRANV